MNGSGGPLIELTNVTKDHGGAVPLVIRHFQCRAADRVALAGLDTASAETLVHLITGAALPETGEVLTAGRSTREISTDVDWLVSLDRFGLVTNRAVLIDALPIAANLALPMTLAVDPMSAETRRAVEATAHLVGLRTDRLDAATSTLDAAERVRLHLGRALALGPAMLILEHPTTAIENPRDRTALGATLRRVADEKAVGWLALTDDETFAAAAGGRRLRLDAVSGVVAEASWWRRLWR